MANEKLETTDLGLAVALASLGFLLRELEPPDATGRVTFSFDHDPGLEESMERYWSGKLLVDPKHYWSECRHLKTRMHSIKANQ